MISMVKKIFSIFFSRLVASAGMSLLAFVVTRLYGLEKTGNVFFIFSIAIAFSTIIKHGSELSAISIVGSGWRSGDRKIVDLFVKKTIRRINAIFLVILVFFGVLLSLSLFHKYIDEVLLAIFLSYPMAVLSFLGAALRASEKIFIGQLADVGGLSFLLSILLVVLHFISPQLQNWQWVSLCMGVSGFFSIFLLMKFFHETQYSASDALLLPRINFHSFTTSLLQYSTGWIAVLISGFLLNAQDMGVLNVCLRYSMLVFMLLNTVASVQAPKYAHYFKERRYELIVRDERNVRIVLSAAALFMVFCVVYFSGFFLSIFNVDHAYDYVLAILMIGQLMNVSFGCAMHVLIATGYHKQYSLIYLFSAFLVITLIPILWYFLQLKGIAMAMACGAFVPAALGYYVFVKKYESLL